jgi:hypothetical protein
MCSHPFTRYWFGAVSKPTGFDPLISAGFGVDTEGLARGAAAPLFTQG